MFRIFSRNNIIAAAESGDTKKVKMLIEDKGLDVNTRNEEGLTPLHAASMKGHIEVARFLIEKGAEVNARTKDSGFTPLLVVFVAKKGVVEMAKLLIENGADVNARSADDGVSILHLAAHGNVELVNALLEKGADINIRNIDYATPLYGAIAGRQLRIVKKLLEKGADINTRAKLHRDVGSGLGGLEMTPLQFAITEGYDPVTEFLIANGADVNATICDPTGRTLTSFEFALECGNKKIAERIREAGGV